MTKKEKKELVDKLKLLPEPTFNELCMYLGIRGEDLEILKFKFRTSPGLTREYIAEELGISAATLDRKLAWILLRIHLYGNCI